MVSSFIAFAQQTKGQVAECSEGEYCEVECSGVEYCEINPESEEIKIAEFMRFIKIPFKRGDVNHDGLKDISDVIYLLNYLFMGGAELKGERTGDVNSDRAVDISDAIYLLSFLFSGGPAPSDKAIPWQRLKIREFDNYAVFFYREEPSVIYERLSAKFPRLVPEKPSGSMEEFKKTITPIYAVAYDWWKDYGVGQGWTRVNPLEIDPERYPELAPIDLEGSTYIYFRPNYIPYDSTYPLEGVYESPLWDAYSAIKTNTLNENFLEVMNDFYELQAYKKMFNEELLGWVEEPEEEDFSTVQCPDPKEECVYRAVPGDYFPYKYKVSDNSVKGWNIFTGEQVKAPEGYAPPVRGIYDTWPLWRDSNGDYPDEDRLGTLVIDGKGHTIPVTERDIKNLRILKINEDSEPMLKQSSGGGDWFGGQEWQWAGAGGQIINEPCFPDMLRASIAAGAVAAAPFIGEAVAIGAVSGASLGAGWGLAELADEAWWETVGPSTMQAASWAYSSLFGASATIITADILLEEGIGGEGILGNLGTEVGLTVAGLEAALADLISDLKRNPPKDPNDPRNKRKDTLEKLLAACKAFLRTGGPAIIGKELYQHSDAISIFIDGIAEAAPDSANLIETGHNLANAAKPITDAMGGGRVEQATLAQFTSAFNSLKFDLSTGNNDLIAQDINTLRDFFRRIDPLDKAWVLTNLADGYVDKMVSAENFGNAFAQGFTRDVGIQIESARIELQASLEDRDILESLKGYWRLIGLLTNCDAVGIGRMAGGLEGEIVLETLRGARLEELGAWKYIEQAAIDNMAKNPQLRVDIQEVFNQMLDDFITQGNTNEAKMAEIRGQTLEMLKDPKQIYPKQFQDIMSDLSDVVRNKFKTIEEAKESSLKLRNVLEDLGYIQEGRNPAEQRQRFQQLIDSMLNDIMGAFHDLMGPDVELPPFNPDLQTPIVKELRSVTWRFLDMEEAFNSLDPLLQQQARDMLGDQTLNMENVLKEVEFEYIQGYTDLLDQLQNFFEINFNIDLPDIGDTISPPGTFNPGINFFNDNTNGWIFQTMEPPAFNIFQLGEAGGGDIVSENPYDSAWSAFMDAYSVFPTEDQFSIAQMYDWEIDLSSEETREAALDAWDITKDELPVSWDVDDPTSEEDPDKREPVMAGFAMGGVPPQVGLPPVGEKYYGWCDKAPHVPVTAKVFALEPGIGPQSMSSAALWESCRNTLITNFFNLLDEEQPCETIVSIGQYCGKNSCPAFFPPNSQNPACPTGSNNCCEPEYLRDPNSPRLSPLDGPSPPGFYHYVPGTGTGDADCPSDITCYRSEPGYPIIFACAAKATFECMCECVCRPPYPSR